MITEDMFDRDAIYQECYSAADDLLDEYVEDGQLTPARGRQLVSKLTKELVERLIDRITNA